MGCRCFRAPKSAFCSIITQGIGTVTGLQKSFSWAGAAAAGVGAEVGDRLGDFGGDGFTGTLVRGGASAIANAATRTALDNRTQFGDNLRAAIPDVIAQAVWAGITYQDPSVQMDVNPSDITVTHNADNVTGVYVKNTTGFDLETAARNKVNAANQRNFQRTVDDAALVDEVVVSAQRVRRRTDNFYSYIKQSRIESNNRVNRNFAAHQARRNEANYNNRVRNAAWESRMTEGRAPGGKFSKINFFGEYNGPTYTDDAGRGHKYSIGIDTGLTVKAGANLGFELYFDTASLGFGGKIKFGPSGGVGGKVKVIAGREPSVIGDTVTDLYGSAAWNIDVGALFVNAEVEIADAKLSVRDLFTGEGELFRAATVDTLLDAGSLPTRSELYDSWHTFKVSKEVNGASSVGVEIISTEDMKVSTAVTRKNGKTVFDVKAGARTNVDFEVGASFSLADLSNGLKLHTWYTGQ